MLTKVSFSMITGAVVNVLDYGANPDGVTECSAEIQDALDAVSATGGTVFFPHGIYLIDTTLTVAGFVNLVGERTTVSTTGSQIKCNNSNINMIEIPAGDWSITDLVLNHNATVAPGTGDILKLGSGVNFCSGGQMTRVTFNSAPQTAVNFYNAGDTILTDCRFESNIYGLKAADVVGSDIRVVNAVFYASYGDVYATQALQWSFSNCLFQLTGTPGFANNYSQYYGGTCNSIVITGSIFDRVGGPILFENGQHIVNGNKFIQPKREAVWLKTDTNYCVISNNVMVDGSQKTANSYDGIFVDSASEFNVISGNSLVDGFRYGINVASGAISNSVLGNTVTAMATGSFTNAGTSTVVQSNNFGNQKSQIGAAGFYLPSPANAIQDNTGMYGFVGAPSNSNGSNGDFYFRSDGGAGTTIYQKRAGSWVGIV
jgi:hypothetical protein